MVLKYLFVFFICIPFVSLQAQEEIETLEIIDSLYREDQFYIGVTFNLLSQKPNAISQNGFSGSLQAGFIRDMPINKSRTKAFGLGVGFAGDTFNQNLLIGEKSGENRTYEVLTGDTDDFTNRFTYYSLEFPVEYRWRTSTPTKYSFWRIHAGVRFGYIFNFNSTYEEGSTAILQRDVEELNTLQYGLTLSFGYGAVNFQGYYGLSTLFNDQAVINGNPVNLKVIRLGLQFFLL